MLIVCLRTLIMYVSVVAAMRLMGKRQIGELQPSELVTTILISNLASLPIEETDISIVLGLVPVALVVSIEIIISVIEVKSEKFSKFVAGESKVLIRDGKLEQKTMKELRFNVTDVLSALRAKQIFDLNEVEFALIETNGEISVFKKTQEGEKPHIPVVIDGKVIKAALSYCQCSDGEIKKLLSQKNTQLPNVLLLTLNNKGEHYLVEKEKK